MFCVLGKVPCIKNGQQKIVTISKHLCGAATGEVFFFAWEFPGNAILFIERWGIMEMVNYGKLQAPPPPPPQKKQNKTKKTTTYNIDYKEQKFKKLHGFKTDSNILKILSTFVCVAIG